MSRSASAPPTSSTRPVPAPSVRDPGTAFGAPRLGGGPRSAVDAPAGSTSAGTSALQRGQGRVGALCLAHGRAGSSHGLGFMRGSGPGFRPCAPFLGVVGRCPGRVGETGHVAGNGNGIRVGLTCHDADGIGVRHPPQGRAHAAQRDHVIGGQAARRQPHPVARRAVRHPAPLKEPEPHPEGGRPTGLGQQPPGFERGLYRLATRTLVPGGHGRDLFRHGALRVRKRGAGGAQCRTSVARCARRTRARNRSIVFQSDVTAASEAG